MNDKLKRLLYLVEYNNKTNRKIIKENTEQLFESKQSEAQALNILKRKLPGVDENQLNTLLSQFKQLDKSKNQILLPVIATMYGEIKNVDRIKHTVESINSLLERNKIKTVIVNKEGKYEIDGRVFDSFINLNEFLHGLTSMEGDLEKYKGKMIQTNVDEKPIFKNQHIEVYDGNDVGKCIKYGGGGLTGKQYGFCIGQQSPSANMWHDYRGSKVSTFYYVLDKTRDLSDPLHIVVVDHTQYGFELTDANNSTGNIAEFGSDPKPYLEYLKSKGVDVDKIFLNKPQTPEEIEKEKLIKDQNTDLEWFKKLPFDLKMEYIGRGHQLSDEQFNFLWNLYERSDEAYTLLLKYVDTGLPLHEKQFNILVGNE